ncbi:hypothetical protein MTR_5g080920 [Medicago truncatula]|uniref:Uncharacterized protein n=1 Tax=Medicago truncatula TaxID=3880 RepID=G7K1Z1_MEDTR|nr:hypothetical protein MTR_5g080920 [Medicago truncatula]
MRSAFFFYQDSMVGPRPLDAEGILGVISASLILFPRISDEETLGEPPTPTTVHVRSILDLTNQSFSGMFRSSFPLLRKSEPLVQVQDTIITAWIIRHPTRNRNDPIARVELYQLSYIPRAKLEHA